MPVASPGLFGVCGAAGDFNGNGCDDVLLTLIGAESNIDPTTWTTFKADVKNPQKLIDLQPVLLDGALFNVDSKNNNFSLANLRSPLKPSGGSQDQKTQSLGLASGVSTNVAILAGVGSSAQDLLLVSPTLITSTPF